MNSIKTLTRPEIKASESSPVEEESIDTLKKLGLSSSQSKVYFNLFKLGEVTANTISRASNIDRGETYRVMSKLIELGLVEKIIDSPIRFKAIPLTEGLLMLMERKKRADVEVISKAQRILEEASITSSAYKEVSEDGEQKTLIVPPGDHLSHLMRRRLAGVQKSYDAVTFLDEFDLNLKSNFRTYRQLLTQGVKMRMIVENLEEKHYYSKILVRLLDNPNFKVRYVFTRIPACFGLYDERNLRISVAKKPNLCESSAFWSTASVFVALAKSYFDSIWSQAGDNQY